MPKDHQPTTKCKVLACLDAMPNAEMLVRQAKALADAVHADWEAVHVATPEGAQDGKGAQEGLLAAFRLVEHLGGQTRTLNGGDAAAEILSYARANVVSHIVVGASSRPAWFEMISASVQRRLVQGAGDIVVQIAPGRRRRTEDWLLKALRVPAPGDPGAYAAAAAFVGIASLFALVLDRSLGLPNASIVFVLAVIAAALRYGAVIAVFASILSALSYNYFLTPPYYSLQIYDPRNVWAVLLFLAAGIAVSGVGARARAQTLIARRQAEQAADLQDFTKELVSAQEAHDVAAKTSETISRLLKARAVVLAPAHGELEVIAESPGPELLGGDDLGAAQWAFDQGRESGHGADALPGARWLFVPLRGEDMCVGALGVRTFDDSGGLDPEQRRFLDLVAGQAGLALDRVHFAHVASDARAAAEEERMKTGLVSAMSHDLRTPLTTIRGAVESVLKLGDKLDAQARRELLQSAAEEAQRLSAAIQNLLDMARLDTGIVRAKRAPTNVADLIDAAIDRVRPLLQERFVSRDVASNLPLINADRALAESALANVLNNAARYSPENATILVRANLVGADVEIDFVDDGPGFSVHALEHLFGRFGRGVEGDGRPAGAGLGLAVSKGLIEAQGGSIEAGNRTDKPGAMVKIRLPAS